MLNITIKKKMVIGFALMGAIILSLSAFAIFGLHQVQHQLKDFVEVDQPLEVGAQDANFLLQKSIAELNFYLLTQDDKALKNYRVKMSQVQAKIAALKFRLAKLQSEEAQAQIAQLQRLESLLAKVSPFIKELEGLQADRNQRIPVFAWVGKALQPYAVQTQQQISLMMASEMADLSAQRQPVLEPLIELQKTWLNVMNAFRGYVAFRTQDWVEATEAYLERFEGLLYSLQKFEEVEPGLTIEEEDGLAQILVSFQKYRQNFEEAKRIHQGEQWRMDIWLMQTKVMPILKDAEGILNRFAGQIRLMMLQESSKSIELASNSLEIQWIFSIIGVLLSIILGQLLSRSVVKPIEHTTQAMRDIAQGEGDLTQRLCVEGKDELSELARHFNAFVARIQQVVSEVSSHVSSLETASDSLKKVTETSTQSVHQPGQTH